MKNAKQQEAVVERVRDALAAESSLREVKMFGGLAFMVNDKMVVSVGGNGDLLVRADPERAEELLAVPGARPAEMGRGRAMGDSWTSVDHASITTDVELTYWIDMGMAYNGDAVGTTARRSGKAR